MANFVKDIIRYVHIFYLLLRTKFKAQINIEGPVLFIAPHPDDEALGCGGLLASICLLSKRSHVIILTGGGGALRNHSAIDEGTVINKRRKLALKSAKELGIPKDNVHFLDFIDGQISERPEKEMQRLKELINEIKPSAILVPHSGEGWPDHIATREIILSLFNTSESEMKTNKVYGNTATNIQHSISIYEYCVWMWYYNVWNLDWKNALKFHMRKEEHQKKLKAIKTYIEPLSSNGKPWSGVLPQPFIYANTRSTELYFRIR